MSTSVMQEDIVSKQKNIPASKKCIDERPLNNFNMIIELQETPVR